MPVRIARPWKPLAAALLSVGAVGAQSARPEPVALDALGWELEWSGSRVAALVPAGLEAERVRFARPVRRLDAARYADGSVVLLVAGVDDPVEFVCVGSGGRLEARIATAQGRRLPARFGGGRGPWPEPLGDARWLVAWDDDDHVEVRVLARSGPVATRQASFDLDRLAVARLPAEGGVEIELVGVDAAPISLPPVSRAVLLPSVAVLDFAAVGERRSVEIVNAGSLPFAGELRLDDGVFELVGIDPGPWSLEAGSRTRLWIERVGIPAGQAELSIGSGRAVRSIVLRAAAVPVEPPPVAEPDAGGEPAPDPVDQNAGDAVSTTAPTEPAPTEPPRVLGAVVRIGTGAVRQRWVGPARIEMSGLVGAGARHPTHVGVTNPRTGFRVVVPVGSDGRFRVVLPASAYDTIRWEAVGEDRGTGRLGTVDPGGFVDGVRAVSMLAPDTPFVIAMLAADAVPPGAAADTPTLWIGRGISGPDGLARVRLPWAAPGEVRLLTRDPDGAVRSTPLVVRAPR